jgi:hypothetical protein
MKAQSLRRLLWLSSGVLALGCAGVVVWFLQEKNAEASAKKAPWIEQAFKAYSDDKARVQPANIYPVSEKELYATVIHDKTQGGKVGQADSNDWMAKEIGVWPYVGPVPPAPKKIEVAAEKPPEPEGIEAIGSPAFVIFQPPPYKSVVRWVFNGSGGKKSGFFGPGEFVKEEGAKGRFRIASIEPQDGGSSVLIRHDVHDDEAKPPVKSGSKVFSLIKDIEHNPFTVGSQVAKAGSNASGAGTAATPASTRPAGTAPTLADARKAVVVTSDPQSGTKRIEFERDAYDYLQSNRAEDVLSRVKTEEVKDAS